MLVIVTCLHSDSCGHCPKPFSESACLMLTLKLNKTSSRRRLVRHNLTDGFIISNSAYLQRLQFLHGINSCLNKYTSFFCVYLYNRMNDLSFFLSWLQPLFSPSLSLCTYICAYLPFMPKWACVYVWLTIPYL